MLRSVFAKTLHDQRRVLAWWTVGLLVLSAMMVGLYPTVRESAAALNQYIEKMPEAMKSLFGGFSDYTTPAGYLKTELFNFMLPVIFLAFAIGAGARAIAGEEERGTLDVLTATPVRRRRIVLDKAGAMLATAVYLGVVQWAGIALVARMAGVQLGLVGLAREMVSLVLLAFALGTLALAIGSVRGRSRALPVAVAAAFAVLTYLVNALADVVTWLRPFRSLTPWHYYSGHDPIVRGLEPLHVGVLTAVALVCVAVAVAGFDRRDLVSA
jgi:ABC-2 type transport system permease protein